MTSRLYSSDEVQYFSYLRSLYFDRDVSFENEYRYFYERNIAQSPGFYETFLERETAVGRRVNYGTIGSAILWLPFYAVADVWTRATGRAEANGFTQPYLSAVAYASAVYGCLAVLLSIRAARLLLPESGSHVWSGLAVWIGTPLLFYMYVAPPFAHATSAYAVALFVSVWLSVRRTWSPRGAFVLGLSAALMAMVREQDAFIALGPLADFVGDGKWKMVNGKARAIGAAIAGVAGTAAGYVPQLLAYNALNGYPGPAEHVSRKMSWYSPHLLQVLASPHHGFFFWTPLAALAIAGLLVLAIRRAGDTRRIALVLLIMVASQVYVAGSVESWTVAGAFGQRRFVCLTIVLVIGLAALRGLPPFFAKKGDSLRFLQRTEAVPFFGVLVVLCVWWNVALMAQFATRLMDRQRLEPARNAYHAFVTLPLSMPSLAYRYLTDRASFYDSDGARQR